MTKSKMSDDILSLLANFREARGRLREHSRKLFPNGSTVTVACGRYEGLGVVARGDECPDDQLPVRIPNENVWHYPIECCEPANIIHGVNCIKAPHVGEGYLHDAMDDTPYDVDGLSYCGRCHFAL